MQSFFQNIIPVTPKEFATVMDAIPSGILFSKTILKQYFEFIFA